MRNAIHNIIIFISCGLVIMTFLVSGRLCTGETTDGDYARKNRVVVVVVSRD